VHPDGEVRDPQSHGWAVTSALRAVGDWRRPFQRVRGFPGGPRSNTGGYTGRIVTSARSGLYAPITFRPFAKGSEMGWVPRYEFHRVTERAADLRYNGSFDTADDPPGHLGYMRGGIASPAGLTACRILAGELVALVAPEISKRSFAPCDDPFDQAGRSGREP